MPPEWLSSKGLEDAMRDKICEVGQNSSGTLELFGVGTGSTLWHIAQPSPGTWTGAAWTQLAPGSVITSEPGVGSMGTSELTWSLDVYARGTDRALWHITQSIQGDWTGAAWAPVSPDSVITSDPEVAIDGDSVLGVFARGTDNAMWHIRQLGPGDWTGAAWAPVGPGSVITSDPAVAIATAGLQDVVARGTDSALWHIAQPSLGNWTGAMWAPVAPGRVITSDPEVADDGSGRLDVVARGTNSALWHIAQPSPGNWTGAAWAPLAPGHVITSDPKLAAGSPWTGAGRMNVFARG